MMRHVIALNGGFFTAERMLHEYLVKAYDVESLAGQAPILAVSVGNIR
jgi:hypothetical protein